MTRLDRLLGIGCALAASAMLVIWYPAAQTLPATPPVPAGQAWPHNPVITVTTSLTDGTSYEPAFFLPADASVGIAASPDHRSLRLLLVSATQRVRVLRSLSVAAKPWFGGLTAAGDQLAWADSTDRSLQLWTIDLRDGRAARQLTADTGHPVFNGTPFDLVIGDGRVYWTASAPNHPNLTEIRSVALTGGPVEVHPESGTWTLSTWPWLVDGTADAGGTSLLRNMNTDRDVPVPISGNRHTTRCDPTWCVVVSLSADGYQIEVVHPNGTARRTVTSGQVAPAIDDTIPLERYVVLSQASPYTDLTNTRQLLVYDLNTNRMIDISAGARTVSYSDGVLWWSTGTQDAPVWHAVNLPTT